MFAAPTYVHYVLKNLTNTNMGNMGNMGQCDFFGTICMCMKVIFVVDSFNMVKGFLIKKSLQIVHLYVGLEKISKSFSMMVYLIQGHIFHFKSGYSLISLQPNVRASKSGKVCKLGVQWILVMVIILDLGHWFFQKYLFNGHSHISLQPNVRTLM